ncbi:hypothetical protein ACIA2T_04450 [Amycolatopsis japonica]|uniref:hypothetical protein n=1 Tax=Amycolatopsis japonica TaxID=208439 RepID=UPI0037AD0A16
MRQATCNLLTAAAILACVSCTQESQPADTSTRSPADALAEDAFRSAQHLVGVASHRSLVADPFFRDSGGFLKTKEGNWKPDDLQQAQIALGRDFHVTLDGVERDSGNEISIRATVANPTSSDTYCDITIEFNFDQQSKLVSGELSTDLLSQALEGSERGHLQLQEIHATTEGRKHPSMDNYSSGGIHILFNFELGAFQTSPPDAATDPQPTTDEDFTRLRDLVNQATKCISPQFDGK